MKVVTPSSPQELAAILESASGQEQRVEVAGAGSKRLWAGPITPSDVTLSTLGLKNIVQYERNDLTISVEAGMRFGELQDHLAGAGQMIALDPPLMRSATVGGVLAANSSGSLRRGFGTARDLVIGMTFATLEGKLVSTGGMVVKNVAGLDMAKLLIGSYGTLGVIVRANFRVHPLPERSRTFLFSRPDLEAVISRRDTLLKSSLRPVAIDLVNPAAGAHLGTRGYTLAIRAFGSQAVLERYARELADAEIIADSDESLFWEQVREFGPGFLERVPSGVVLRARTPLADIYSLVKSLSQPAISRCGSGVTYIHLNSWSEREGVWELAQRSGWRMALEAGPENIRHSERLWIGPPSSAESNTSATIERVKSTFDPHGLLNRSRLYGRT